MRAPSAIRSSCASFSVAPLVSKILRYGKAPAARTSSRYSSISFKRSSSLATAITRRVGWEPSIVATCHPNMPEGRRWRQVSPLRHQHGLADDGAFLDQLEGLHPVCEVVRAGDGGLELVLGEPAHQLLLRLGHQDAAPADRSGLLRRRRRLATPAGVVAIVET